MKKNVSFFKQAQAWILSVALVMSMAAPLSSLTAFAETNKTETTTDGKIVAQNYELSGAEEGLLASGLLIGASHTYLVPDSDDGLITVDTDNKKITVASYEGTTGYEWKAVSVNIVVGNEVKETVSITNGEGNYTFEGNAFSVVAEYALDVNVDAETQKTLLNTPKYLKDGLANLKDTATVKSNLAIIEQAMPEMVKLATVGILVNIQGTYVPITFSTDEAKSSTLALNEQMTANNGKLDITVMIEEYENANSKVQYLIENGTELKEKAAETQKHIENILTATFWGFIGAADATEHAVLLILRSALNDSSKDLKAVSEKTWDAAEKKLVKDGITAAEYSEIDAMMADITALTDVSAIEIKNPLRASTAKIQHNMSMFDVTVKVALNLTDATSEDIKYYEYDSKSTTVTLAEGATKAEIIAAVLETGIESSAKASWGAAFVDGKFTAEMSELPAELKKDIEYTITYKPNMYDVTFAYGNIGKVSYPYGYIVKLESHENAEKAYDYTINGTYYAQGSSYKVIDNADISRKEGKSYISSNLYQIVADNYLTGKGVAILTSGALFGNEAVAVRYPDNSNGIVTLTGDKLTAADFVASYKGLSWKPYSYTLSNNNTYLFDGKNEVEINESFDNVTVNYRLYLTNYSNDTVIDIANLANMLDEEAKAQIGALDRISTQQQNLADLNKQMIGIIAGLINNTELNPDTDKNTALKKCFTDALNSIQTDCMNATDFYLLDIINAYKGAKDGLLYYYNNNEVIRNEIDKLANLMSDMLGENSGLTKQEKIDALAALMRSLPSSIVKPEDVDRYVGKLTTLESTMTEVRDNLSAPNAVIDLNSDKLGTLTKALQSAGSTEKFTSLNDSLFLEDSTIVVVAANKTAITVTLQIEGGKNTTVTSDAVFDDVTIDQSFVDALKNAISAKLAEQSVSAKYYNTAYNESIFDALVGKLAGELTQTKYEFVWTYKTFEVSVPGTEAQKVSYKDRGITLPVSTDSEYRYDYYINGVRVNDTSYTLSDAELDKVIDGTFSVTRKSVNIGRESLVNYVNSLNESIGDNQAIFALIENNGKYAIVLKIDASAPNGLTSAVQGMATGMVQGSYPYVGIDNSAFLSDGTIYLQSIVDALLNSGFGSEEMLRLVDRDGNINNMAAPEGDIITYKPLGAMGGKLIETTIQLGTSKSDATSVPFYVTLGAVGSEFVDIRNMYEEELGNLTSFVFENGEVDVLLNMPEKAYEAFLAVLLVTENLSLNDIHAVNGQIAVTFVNELLIPLFKGDITVKTFENTLKKFGYEYNLSSKKGAEKLFSVLKSFYTGSTFNYDETSGLATGNIGIASFIESMNVGVLGNIIAEKDTGIDLNVRIKLQDLGKEYEAIYVDMDASGMKNKVGLTADLNKKLSEMAGTSAVVLLKDIEKDLTFNKATLINLNGFKVNGDLTANAKTIVIDSGNNVKNGEVTGKVSGNIILSAGKYTEDVSAYVKNGFAQGADGVVANQYYDISKDVAGNITVSVNAGLVNVENKPYVTGLAIDLACDILFNGYSSNYLELEGKLIYNITFEDLIGLYGESNRADTIISETMDKIDNVQLSEFLNIVLKDAMDFDAISNAIANDAPVFEYDMTTKPWDIELVHDKSEDCITGNVISADEAQNAKIKVYVVGEKEDKTLISDLFKELGKTVTSDAKVSVSHSKDGNSLVINVVAEGNVMVDWTNPNYAVMFGVIIADGLPANERADLVAAIRSYYETGSLDALSYAFNSLKSSQAITAIKNFSATDSFADMLKALGLENTVKSDVAELEALYDRVGKAAAYVVRREELVGGNRTLGSFLDSDGTYGMTRENIERIFSKALFRGYALKANILIENAVVKIKLFDKNVTELDLTELNNQISIAENLKEDEYTADSWKVLEEKLAEAIEARKATTQAAVDAAAQALKDAIAALEKKIVINYDELNKQIDIAQKVNKNDYTDDSVKVLEAKLAEAIEARKATTQAEVDAAAKALENAIKALKLKAPKFVNGTGNAEVLKNDKILGSVVDHANKFISLDADINGMTVAELKALLKFYADNADTIDIVIGDGTLKDTDLVANGTKVTATAKRNGVSEVDVVTYTIIVLGDLNCNGRIEVGDAVYISRMLVGEITFTDIQTLAADTNCNGRTDIGDATRIASKYVDSKNYETMLGKAIM